MKAKDNHINYVEFKAKALNQIKELYTSVFSWSFTDYGSNYVGFSDSGLEGGFELTSENINNGILVELYHKNLESIKQTIIEAGGIITKEIFSFPEGNRFQFTDPSNNELAVWSEK